MDIILYNPLSRSGNNQKLIKKLVNKLAKENRKIITKDITRITNVEEFINDFDESDRFIIIGGDGTLNVLANKIQHLNIKQDILLYKAGTGNDFVRSITKKKGLVDIKKYLFDLPKVEFLDQTKYFLNGIGLGLDGLVVNIVNTSRLKNNKFNYFRNALKGFKEYKVQPAEIIIDNEIIKVDKAWMVAIMNSEYFGGGMKIAPYANRNERMLDIVIVKNVSRFVLFLIFPTIYFGAHKFFKKYVNIIKSKEVVVKFENDQYLQIDGDDFPLIKKVKVSID